jgi:hypothetical protein
MEPSRTVAAAPPGRRGTSGLRDSRFMRGVNRNLGLLSVALGHPDPVMFFCECRRASCYAPIFMPLAAFDATVVGQLEWLLAEGHAPSAASVTAESAPVAGTPPTPALRWRGGRRLVDATGAAKRRPTLGLRARVRTRVRPIVRSGRLLTTCRSTLAFLRHAAEA